MLCSSRSSASSNASPTHQNWQDVDVLSATLTVARSKNGHQRTVPMNGTVRSVFLDASLNRKRTDQRLGGWRTLSMVQRYAHLAPDHLRAAVERLTVAELGVNLDSTPSPDSTRV